MNGAFVTDLQIAACTNTLPTGYMGIAAIECRSDKTVPQAHPDRRFLEVLETKFHIGKDRGDDPNPKMGNQSLPWFMCQNVPKTMAFYVLREMTRQIVKGLTLFFQSQHLRGLLLSKMFS